MLAGLFRYYICLTLITHHMCSVFNGNCSTGLCHDRTTYIDGVNIFRKKRAPPAVCSTSSNDITHSLFNNICCDPMIPLFIDNQLSTNDGIGAISLAVQQRIQLRFNASFEVIISENDFVINTYYSGPRQCKFKTDRYFVALYQTPVLYDISDIATELALASVDSEDPLGWKQSPLSKLGELPKEASIHEVAQETTTVESWKSTNATCLLRNQVGPSKPYAFLSNECCDRNLNNIMRDAATLSRDALYLGDAAKYIQRRIQFVYGTSFEVVVSKSNFAISTYYHGTSSCKISDENYHYAAYATPVAYDPFDMVQEDLLASTDSEEPLGSTRYENIRGDFPDARIDWSAGEDRSLQPSITHSRALLYQGAGGPGRTSGPIKDLRNNIVFSEEDNNLAIATVIDGFHVGGNRTLGTVVSREQLAFPPGTHCNHSDRTGDKCCSSALFETMSDVFYELSSSPQFTSSSVGNIASLIQKRAQHRFSQSYEVIVSTGDFAVASYSYGIQICKYRERGFVSIAYATPKQYDITQKEAEKYFATISARDNLGAWQPFLPGQRPFHTPLATYTKGPQAGLPVGSHCLNERAGSKCCSAALFYAMNKAYEKVIENPNFNPYDTRRFARMIQFIAEEALQMSFEVFVASDDFAFSSSYSGDNICKYRVDRYYIMVYETPVQYPLHSSVFDDCGPAMPSNCPAEMTTLQGPICCDGTMQYIMARIVDEASMKQSIDRNALTKAVQRGVQLRFNTTFESIFSRSDFAWKTHIYNEFTCKFLLNGYYMLTVESSKEPPPLSDFIDVQPPGPSVVLPLQSLTPSQPSPHPPAQFPAQPQAQAPAAQPAQMGFFPGAPGSRPAFPSPRLEGGLGVGTTQGAGACFSTDTWVTVPGGKKRMDQLKTGDFVLTANLTTAYYAPISLWIHREPNVVTDFITIMTDYGKMLALTSRHLIFRNKCGEYYEDLIDVLPPNSQAVYADELKVGDCVYLLYKDGFRQQKLQDISITSRRGIFSPLTPNGRIIVNDILASCYSDVNEAILQSTYFSMISSLRKRVLSVFGSRLSESIDQPFGFELSLELLRLVVPHVK